MKKAIVLAFVTVLTLGLMSTAHAIPITYKFSGILDRITNDYNILNDEFRIDDRFFGSFTYETNTLEGSTTLGDSTIAIYSAITNFNVNINGYIIERDSSLNGYLQIWDNYIVGSSTVDAFTISSGLDYTPPISGMGPGTVVAAADVNLFDNNHIASTNGISIPNSINFLDYESPLFSAIQLNVDTEEVFHLNGIVTSLKMVSVPEPSSFILLLSGLTLLFCRRQIS